MPRFYHRGLGATSPAPNQIQQLPFDLLRSHIYPRDPVAMRDAVDQSGDVPPAAYLPARFMETRWKTPPYQQGWGTNVVALMQAMQAHVDVHTQANASVAHVPGMSMDEAPAALGADRLPQPSDNFDPHMDATPLARNALPDSRIMVRAADLQALAQQQTDQRTAAGAVTSAKLENALASAASSFTAVRRILGG